MPGSGVVDDGDDPLCSMVPALAGSLRPPRTRASDHPIAKPLAAVATINGSCDFEGSSIAGFAGVDDTGTGRRAAVVYMYLIFDDNR